MDNHKELLEKIKKVIENENSSPEEDMAKIREIMEDDAKKYDDNAKGAV